jgi:hypothetical protein
MLYEQERTIFARSNLSQFVQQEIPDDFYVDCACSGGGYRAMIATTALIAALQDIHNNGTNLYNCTRNMVGLSGSTWGIGHFMARDIPIEEFVFKLKERVIGHNLTEQWSPTLHIIADNLEIRYGQTRELQIVDLWGGLIADKLMGDMGSFAHNVCLNDFTSTANIQKYPHPIFTTIHPNKIPYLCCWSKTVYNWFEINPNITRQILSSSCFIPTKMLGLPIRTPLPEDSRALLPLSSLFGFCGSAFACSLGDVFGFLKAGLIEHFKAKRRSAPSAILNEIIYALESGRLFPGRVPDFTCSDDTDLLLIDAGIACNIPTPPLLERQSPIIIICDADASSGTYAGRYPELYKAADYASAHHLPFPSLNYPDRYPFLQVFKRNADGDVDPQVPTIFYFHNSVKKSTFDFVYTEEEFNEIFSGMYCSVVRSADVIREEITNKITTLAH